MTLSGEKTKKVSPRRLQLALEKIVDDAIPHHLECLEQHKVKIDQLVKQKKENQLLKEQVQASQTVQKLRAELQELDNLRTLVDLKEAEVFNQKLTSVKTKVLQMIKEFETLNASVVCSAVIVPRDSTDPEEDDRLLYENLQMNAENHKSRTNLSAWEVLTKELFDLKFMVNSIATLLMGQREQLTRIEDNVEHSADAVTRGTVELSKAAALRASVIPMTAAIIGGAVCGPVGLVAGFKMAGIVSAVGGSVLGYAGGRIIQKKAFGTGQLEMIAFEKKDEADQKGTQETVSQ